MLTVFLLFQERCKMAKFIGDRLHHLENRLEDLRSSLTQQYRALRQHLLSSLHELEVPCARDNSSIALNSE